MGWYVIVPFSVASLWVAQSPKTVWGLLRHYWVIAKLLIGFPRGQAEDCEWGASNMGLLVQVADDELGRRGGTHGLFVPNAVRRRILPARMTFTQVRGVVPVGLGRAVSVGFREQVGSQMAPRRARGLPCLASITAGWSSSAGLVLVGWWKCFRR
ncbi:hypothetical protein YWIDRAFT_06334 [Streptomyces sp. SceaMP-e96]|nr:hypothetical protein YWIDRAFT_06334 [Streptomyces sp. SceaMP-e96]